MAVVLVLECAICGEKFSEEDVEVYKFFPQNHVCYKCCRQMQKSDYSVSCFGKPTSSCKRLGYDPKTPECASHCPDRLVCKVFVTGEVRQMRELTKEARLSAIKFLMGKPPKRKKPPAKVVFRPGTIIGKAFQLCLKGCTMQELCDLCNKEEANIPRVLRVLRTGHSKGHEWIWHEENGQLSITYGE